MDKLEIIQYTGAFLGSLGVAAGAFGSHALKAKLEERGSMRTWDIAVRYHLIHALGILLVGAFGATGNVNYTTLAFCFFGGGVLLFSGSLYALALGGPRWLGPITPLGGLALIAGWICLGLI